ncbi:MAG TPA: type IX secretion system membrane protein PorP/SprF [Cyclobacteriaceae bacterium]|nr:type IX secretion system membrane protein PorP/SprF [Cyclobacteriaceae bacterium]
MVQIRMTQLVRRLVCISALFSLFGTELANAQDPQFSQFYAAPLYLNPAFTGSTNQGRAGINYRNQWPAIDANFTTISAFADFYLEDYKSGVGMIINRDYVNLVGLQSLSLALQYSYDLEITKGLSFRPGIEVALYNRSINFGRLTFGDQFDFDTGQPTNPTGEQLRGSNKFFPDLSAGGVFYTPNAWVGFSAHHLTQPNQSISGDNSPLPIKYSVHGGYKFFLKPGVMGTGVYSRKSERSIAPAVQYRHQGPFDQMDVGMYYTFEPILLGTWYRGIPFKEVNGFSNNESLVLLVGLTIFRGNEKRPEVLNIGYSYDYTISKLGPGSGGSHEFSLVYTFPIRNPRKPPLDKMIIPCPEF